MYKISAKEWITALLPLLDEGKQIKINPTGYSMYPFLVSKRDSLYFEKIKKPLRRGDICLYEREDGTFVTHTVFKVKPEGIFMLGDGQDVIEGPLKAEQFLAVAVSLTRKGHNFSCNNLIYKFLHNLWLDIYPLRIRIIWIWLQIRKLTGKDKGDNKE